MSADSPSDRIHAGTGPCAEARAASASAQRPWPSLRPSRRQFIRTGVLGGLGLSLGGLLAGGGAIRSVAAQSYAFFRAQDVTLVRTVVPVMLDGLLPRAQQDWEQAVQGIVRGADGYFAALSPATQAEVLQAFDLLHLAPVRWLGAGVWSSWERATAEDVREFLAGWRGSYFALPRQVYLLLYGVAVVGWFGDPMAWDALGYPGPPQVERPTETGPL